MNNQQNIEDFFNEFMDKVHQVQQKLPDIIGTEVVNHSLDNFKSESFEGQKWKPRKDLKNKRKLLVASGTLRRSITILTTGPNHVTVGSDVPYAAIHNNGGIINRAARSELFVRNRYKTGTKGKMFGGMGAFRRGTTPGQGQTYRAYTINIPQRQFLGASHKLKEHLLQVIRREVISAL